MEQKHTPEESVSGDYILDLEGKEPKRVLTGFSATMIVVASMVGTGVFTTTGWVLNETPSTSAVLIAWLIGGIVAFFGALSYAELVSMYPRNGGEYQILSRVFHPSVGVMAGFMSLIVGFSAPIASAAMAFTSYFRHFLAHASVTQTIDPDPTLDFVLGFSVILLFSIIHSINVRYGGFIQNLLTLVKILIVLVFIMGGFYLGDFSRLTTESVSDSAEWFLTPAFATGLIYITYAYTGWNGSAYIAGEIKNPSKAMPRALAFGTGLVTLIYLGINIVFLISAPIQSLSGITEVGAVAADALFGSAFGSIFSLIIAFLLLSSLSAMVMSGPRIYQSMGEDYPLLKFLTLRKGGSGPFLAIALQALIASAMLLSASFVDLITYMGFTLSINSALTVIGVYVMRKKSPDAVRPYKCWGYPVTPAIFILLSLWMVIFTCIHTPMIAFCGICTILMGFLLYFVINLKRKPEKPKETK